MLRLKGVFKTISWVGLSMLIVILDQFSKHWANHVLVFNQPKRILPFLDLSLSYNDGAAYGFLGGLGGWQVILLSAISIIASIVLLVWLIRVSRTETFTAFCLSLVLGGAVGNLIDRVFFKYVTDFILFHVGDWRFATFNLADAAISIGAVLLIGKLFFHKPGFSLSKRGKSA